MWGYRTQPESRCHVFHPIPIQTIALKEVLSVLQVVTRQKDIVLTMVTCSLVCHSFSRTESSKFLSGVSSSRFLGWDKVRLTRTWQGLSNTRGFFVSVSKSSQWWIFMFLEHHLCALSSSLALHLEASVDCSLCQNNLGSERLQSKAATHRGEQWAVPLPGLLPAVHQLFPEPAGQRLTHSVEQLRQLNVVIPVVLPEEHLGLKEINK